MRYRVVIGWRCTFIFDEPYEAMSFAVNAIKHRDPEDKDNENEIRIEFFVPERETGEEDSEND